MFINFPQCILNDQATDNKKQESLLHYGAYSFHNLMIVLLSQQYKESNNFLISGVHIVVFVTLKGCIGVRVLLKCCVIKHRE